MEMGGTNMKIHFDDDMKKKILTYGSVAAIGILLYFSVFNMDSIHGFFSSFFGLISPFILGFAIAFLLNKPMEFIEEKLLGKLKIKQTHKRNIAAIGAIIFGIIIVGAFLALLIPQLAQSIFSLIQAAPGYIEDTQNFVTELMKEYTFDLEEVKTMFGGFDLFEKLTTFFTSALPEMIRLSYRFASGIFNVVLGIMSGLYILIDKEKLLYQTKVMNYAIFPKEVADYLVRLANHTADIFNNFIIGKAIDSLIIGILCYIGLIIMNMPYALLLSVIVGVTNMIPVFGPFIGAVPGIIILMIIHPIYALYFALFILLLQQFDGNILGPLILGDKLGLPSIGILFAVCVGGGLFGIIGMFIGVPIFAVIYSGIKEFLRYRLMKKNIDIDDIKLNT